MTGGERPAIVFTVSCWIGDEIPSLAKQDWGFFPSISDSRFLQHCDNGVRRGDQSAASLAAHIAVFQGHLNRIDEGIVRQE
jgi:hypothetical protein